MQTIPYGVLGLNRDEEITGYHLGALVDKLVECMLTVGPWLPTQWACLVVNPGSRLGDVLSIGFHVTLLEIGSKAVHVLVIGQHGVGLTAVEVDIPDAQESQQDGAFLSRGVFMKCWSIQ